MNITKADCCRISPEFSYTDRELTSVEFFFATAIGGGMECAPCVENCKNVKCGANKKCVKRKGRPKCICAPECGAAKRRKQQQVKLQRQQQKQILLQQQKQHHIKRFSLSNEHYANSASLSSNGKSPRDIRSLSSEITNFNLGLDDLTMLNYRQQKQQEQQQQHSLPLEQTEENQRNNHLLPLEREGRILITANVEKPTSKRRLQALNRKRHQHHHHHHQNHHKEPHESHLQQGLDKTDNFFHGSSRERQPVRHKQENFDDLKVSPLVESKSRSSLSRHDQEAIASESNELSSNKKDENKQTRKHHQNNNEKHRQKHRKQHQEEHHRLQNLHHQQRKHHQKEHVKHILENEDSRLVEGIKGGEGKVVSIEASEMSSRHFKNAPNDNEDENKHIFHNHAEPQNKIKENHNNHNHRSNTNNNNKQPNKQQEIKDQMLNSSHLTAKAKSSYSAAPAQTSMDTASATNDLIFTSATPVNSVSSGLDHHQRNHRLNLNLVNHGSDFATSSLSSPSSSLSSIESATTGAGTRVKTTFPLAKEHHSSSSALSGVDVAVPTDRVNTDYRHRSRQQHKPHSGSSSNSIKTDDTTFLDDVFDQYNLHGFPNQHYSLTHLEFFHGSHPVCGSDGRTYNTECQLRKRACRTNNANLNVAYRGHCKTSCKGVKCLNGLTCVEDQFQIPHCITCNIKCPRDDADDYNYNGNSVIDETRAVCGVDGKTYKSTCDINRMICKIGRAIAIAYPGPCRGDRVTCEDINCGPKNTCLVDLLTHEPRCVSCRYKCSRKRRPKSLRFEEGKICGVNNRTYHSWCEMRKDSCSTGFYIDAKSSGECTKSN